MTTRRAEPGEPVVCFQCGEREATTSWGFPVCQPCADSLTALDAELKAMEAADPDLAEKGRRAEAALREMAGLDPEPPPPASSDAVRRLREGDRPADWDDDDRRLADCVAMIGRMGAKSLSIGFLVDDPPPGAANWYASAEFRAGTLVTEPQMTPVAATEELLAILQAGAKCAWCGRRVSWGDRPAKKDRAKRCWWRKVGGRWEKGCASRPEKAIKELP